MFPTVALSLRQDRAGSESPGKTGSRGATLPARRRSAPGLTVLAALMVAVVASVADAQVVLELTEEPDGIRLTSLGGGSIEPHPDFEITEDWDVLGMRGFGESDRSEFRIGGSSGIIAMKWVPSPGKSGRAFECISIADPETGMGVAVFNDFGDFNGLPSFEFVTGQWCDSTGGSPVHSAYWPTFEADGDEIELPIPIPAFSVLFPGSFSSHRIIAGVSREMWFSVLAGSDPPVAGMVLSTLGTASLTLVVDSVPADGTDFQFEGVHAGATDFQGDELVSGLLLDDAVPDDGDGFSNSETLGGLIGDTYDITQTLPPNWGVSGVTCTGGSDPGSLDGATLTVSIAPREDVICTFSNALATYAITTSTDPVEGGTVICAPNPVAHGGTSVCTATADTGYTFGGWSGDCTGSICELVDVTSPQSVTASFDLISVTLPTASGLGDATISIVGPGCNIESAQFVVAPDTLPENTIFPYGLADFSLTGCTSAAEVTIEYPAPVTGEGVRYWKESGGVYSEYPATIEASSATFTLTDNGPGDSDPSLGTIHDPSGVGAPRLSAVAIPALGTWGLALLAVLLALLGLRRST